MTPDVIQQWLMAYSEPFYQRLPLRHDLREVQNTQYNVRRFLSNLAFLSWTRPNLRRRPGHLLPLPAAPAAAEA